MGTPGLAQSCGVAPVKSPGLAVGWHGKSRSRVGMLERAAACPRQAGKILGLGRHLHSNRVLVAVDSSGKKEVSLVSGSMDPHSYPMTPACLGASLRRTFPKLSRAS